MTPEASEHVRRMGSPHFRLPHPPLRRPGQLDPLAWSQVLEQRYVRLRLGGWMLIALWQVLSLVSEFWPLPLESDVMRITGKALGLIGLVMVAVGFERLVHLAHMRERLRQS